MEIALSCNGNDEKHHSSRRSGDEGWNNAAECAYIVLKGYIVYTYTEGAEDAQYVPYKIIVSNSNRGKGPPGCNEEDAYRSEDDSEKVP